jgi:hypothetical protein
LEIAGKFGTVNLAMSKSTAVWKGQTGRSRVVFGKFNKSYGSGKTFQEVEFF